MMAAKQFQHKFWMGIVANPQATLAAVRTQRVECAAKRDAYDDIVRLIDKPLAEHDEMERYPF